ncbi:hypothetical protein F7725_023842 [Dissostichus mawsoni]|uniref:Uncharacterized protein n=1 Tax=Dissostichus mawsoni TaxID=36200 RepID=A0A7J5XYE5_DISMA|nr:hypothetical protein F7725_023842 [Dissostichus mawsoni]
MIKLLVSASPSLSPPAPFMHRPVVEPLTPRERKRERERVTERGREQTAQGVFGHGGAAAGAKPAMGTRASIHIQILPGGRSKEAIDGGMEVNIPDLSVVLLVLGGAESGLLGQLTKQSQSFTSQRSKHQRSCKELRQIQSTKTERKRERAGNRDKLMDGLIAGEQITNQGGLQDTDTQ